MTGSAFDAIRAVDYTVIITRDFAAMRTFYESVLRFELERALSETWLEYRVGSTILALSQPGLTAQDDPVSPGTASLQLAFCVARDDVDACAAELAEKDIEILSPPTDRDFGHRTLFFRDPDGNLLEIYAEI
ncbi:Glyoxalase/bleomycin resistance protein [Sulfitobacter noctilucicola]|uniref:Catechol 2,3-dioxygenase-like lactoylglutathione lyase family enzyme n=1 Tax=Sulfitobacter noctilucicola TaxID=1342301 RepID=A0A7W6M8K9_9RHOB|nr:VOC family protein [Sulfitobacter noctilucicola]KIN64361.1 Glyoxalase/bleomycin resistance protein [Sulfitobacter noctilucicola]MBB4174478.1 catechol 2,3-dioxygenase-like lactoylglutathione lyase family enzyme [Sulfitobacter noctilucicola]